MNSDESVESGLPWYHFFWPWFIAILLGLSVLGSLWTVMIAFKYQDVDVRVLSDVDGASNPVVEEVGSESRESP